MASPKLLLRAFDASERTARRGRASVQRRVRRLGFRSFFILQCAVTAGLALWTARTVLGHPAPMFAPVAAIICLGFSFGQRVSRAVEIGVGVAVGVLIGEIFVHVAGSGPWQVAVVVAVSMAAATLLGARNLMVTQSGIQSAVVVALLPAMNPGFGRWLDAAIGCVLALLMTLIAPSSPVVRPRLLVAEALQEVAGTLRATRDALAGSDEDQAQEVLDRARHTESRLSAIEEANREGMAVARQSFFVARRDRSTVQSIAALYTPLDRLMRNLRVLTRRAVVVTWREGTVAPDLLALIDEQVAVIDYMAGELYDQRLPTAAQKRLVALGARSAAVELPRDLSQVVILAQLRSMTVDLLQLSGLSYVDARELIPDSDG